MLRGQSPTLLSTHLEIPFVNDAIRNHRSRIGAYSNPLLELILKGHYSRRLQRAWPPDV
jgi:hypothetical protein